MSRMTKELTDYREVAPPGQIDLLFKLSKQVRGKRMLHVTSSRREGVVAEILQSLIPLLLEVGIQARWEILKGTEPFLEATQRLQEGLLGQDVKLADALLEAYVDSTRTHAGSLDLEADVVMTHDPHPLALIEGAPSDSRWIWRCHLDMSRPQRKVWAFLRPYVIKYDAAVFSLPQFTQPLPLPQFLIQPSIDPLSEKNRELAPEELDQLMAKLQIPRDKPILLQVSRFNRLKDPVGVVAAYRLVKTHHDCRLVIAGANPAGDPESQAVLAQVRDLAGQDEDIHLLLLDPDSDLEINALQRSASIILQKSTREGFGLAVAEGMWKGKPVIGGETGGITLQVTYGQTGYTVTSVEGTAFYTRYLLNNPAIAEEFGRRAKERARQHFLITRHLGDYLALMILMGRS